MKKLALFAMAVSMIGCSEFQTQQQFSAGASLKGVSDGENGDLSKPYCELDYADYELDAHLIGFEMRDKNNINFGFNLLSGFLKALSIGFSSESGKMTMSMKLSETLRPLETITDVAGQGTFTKLDFSIGVDTLANINAGIGHSSSTPVGKLVEKTVMDSYKQTVAELATVETEWKTKVVKVLNPSELIIPVGSVAGLRKGDQFKIFNLDNVWSSTPCKSTLVFQRETTDAPIAKAQVVQLEKNAAIIRIYDVVEGAPKVELGARVKIESLPVVKNDKKKIRTLNRSIRIRNVASEKMILPGNQSVDLSMVVGEELGVLLNQYGFYSRK